MSAVINIVSTLNKLSLPYITLTEQLAMMTAKYFCGDTICPLNRSSFTRITSALRPHETGLPQKTILIRLRKNALDGVRETRMRNSIENYVSHPTSAVIASSIATSLLVNHNGQHFKV
jgi:hypothetical protein